MARISHRVAFFVDGFNLYHALSDDRERRGYKWLDLGRLCRAFLTSQQTASAVLYFTALAHWNSGKVERHQRYLRALRSSAVKIIFGEFKRIERRCRCCGCVYPTFEEKQTDVNIAVNLFGMATHDEFDAAAIVSGDTDLVPAIEALHRDFPAKQVGVILPPGRRAKLLMQTTDFHHKIKRHHLESCQFPPEIGLEDGSRLLCPQSWRQGPSPAASGE